MSRIVHRCAVCGRCETEHANRMYEPHTPEYGPSELVPTFDKNGQHVERCIPPGDGIHSLGRPIFDDVGQPVGYADGPGQILLPTCGCEDCQALYATLAEAAS